MKVLTLNFLTCAVKACKSGGRLPPKPRPERAEEEEGGEGERGREREGEGEEGGGEELPQPPPSSSASSFPLHVRDAELVRQEMDFQPAFVRNIVPRLDWDALRVTATEVKKKNFF